MKKIQLLYLFFLLLHWLAGTPAWADNGQAPAGSWLAALFDLVTFSGAVLCLLYCFKLSLFTKGGELYSGWQLATGSFLLLALGQLLAFFGQIGLMSAGENWAGVFRIAALGILLWGLNKIKQVLS